VVDRRRDAEFAAFADDKAVERIDFSFFAAHHVLRSGAARSGHLLRDLIGSGERDLRVLKKRKMDAGSFGNEENLKNGSLEELARIGAGENFAVGDFAERGDGVESAVPDQLGPEFSGEMVGEFAGNSGAFEEGGNAFGDSAFRAEDEVAAADMLDGAWGRDRRGDINRSRESVESRSRVNLFGVIDAVLHADDDCIFVEERGEFASGVGGVGGLDTEKDEFGVVRSGEVGGGLDLDAFLELRGVEEEAVTVNGLNEGKTADKYDRRSGAGEHAAEVATDGASPDDSDFGEEFRGHVAGVSILSVGQCLVSGG